MQTLSDRFILAVAFSVGLVIVVLSSVTNHALLRCNLPGAAGLVKWNAAAGILSILLVWRLLRWSRERNELIRERDRIAMQLNHEVRNAIQVISLNDFHNYGDTTTNIKLSVTRIERALEEYMPSAPQVRLHRDTSQRMA
jgi:hypothetical protein